MRSLYTVYHAAKKLEESIGNFRQIKPCIQVIRHSSMSNRSLIVSMCSPGKVDMRYGFLIISLAAVISAAAPLMARKRTGVTAASVLPDGPSPAIKGGGAVDSVDLEKCVDSRHYLDHESRASGEFCDSRLKFSEKLQYFAHHSFGPGTFIGPLFTAAPEIANPPAHYPSQWRRGAEAFEKLYGDALAWETAQQTGRFLTGVVLHEDPRYLVSSSHKPFVRAIHAVLFTAFDKSDSGRTTLALSNFGGAASAGFVGNAYLPRGYNDTSHAITRTGIAFGSFAVTNLGIEFSPELRRIGRELHLPKFLLSDQPEK